MKMFSAPLASLLPEKCVITAASAQFQGESLLLSYYFSPFSLNPPIFQEHQNANLIILCESTPDKMVTVVKGQTTLIIISFFVL